MRVSVPAGQAAGASPRTTRVPWDGKPVPDIENRGVGSGRAMLAPAVLPVGRPLAVRFRALLHRALIRPGGPPSPRGRHEKRGRADGRPRWGVVLDYATFVVRTSRLSPGFGGKSTVFEHGCTVGFCYFLMISSAASMAKMERTASSEIRVSPPRTRPVVMPASLA